MKGHDQYRDLLATLIAGGRDQALIEVLEDTAIFDVAGAHRKAYPFSEGMKEKQERGVIHGDLLGAMKRNAARDGITALDMPKWAMVDPDHFIVHMERMREGGKDGCKARLFMMDGADFYFCPVAVFIPDSWESFALMEWEKTDRDLTGTKIQKDVGLVVRCAWQGATRLEAMPPDYVVNEAGRWLVGMNGIAL